MGRREKLVDPPHWAGLKPFGIGEGRPHNYREMVKAVRENRGRLGYAWRILREGTCDAPTRPPIPPVPPTPASEVSR